MHLSGGCTAQVRGVHVEHARVHVRPREPEQHAGQRHKRAQRRHAEVQAGRVRVHPLRRLERALGLLCVGEPEAARGTANGGPQPVYPMEGHRSSEDISAGEPGASVFTEVASSEGQAGGHNLLESQKILLQKYFN